MNIKACKISIDLINLKKKQMKNFVLTDLQIFTDKRLNCPLHKNKETKQQKKKAVGKTTEVLAITSTPNKNLQFKYFSRELRAKTINKTIEIRMLSAQKLEVK